MSGKDTQFALGSIVLSEHAVRRLGHIGLLICFAWFIIDSRVRNGEAIEYWMAAMGYSLCCGSISAYRHWIDVSVRERAEAVAGVLFSTVGTLATVARLCRG